MTLKDYYNDFKVTATMAGWILLIFHFLFVIWVYLRPWKMSNFKVTKIY